MTILIFLLLGLLDNISKLKDINIAGIAVVSAIMKANDITATSGQLVRELNHD